MSPVREAAAGPGWPRGGDVWEALKRFPGSCAHGPAEAVVEGRKGLDENFFFVGITEVRVKLLKG